MGSELATLLSFAGMGLFCLVSLYVGTRLLRLHALTRQRPELMGGLALLGIGPLGFAPALLSPHLVGISPWLGAAVWAAAFFCTNAGTGAAYLFTFEVFRPGVRHGRPLLTGILAILVACWFAELWVTGFAADQPSSAAARVADVVRTTGFLWGAAESLHYYRMLRRRALLGLGEGAAMDRMLWWAVGLGSAGVIGVIDTTTRMLDSHAYELAWLTLLTATGGTTAALGIWRAFGTRRSNVLDSSSAG